MNKSTLVRKNVNIPKIRHRKIETKINVFNFEKLRYCQIKESHNLENKIFFFQYKHLFLFIFLAFFLFIFF